MMERKIDTTLDGWLQNKKQAILIYGARQVGKTYSIRACFKRNNIPFTEINFATDKTALNLFSTLKSVEDFYMKLSLLSSKKLIPLKSAVFLDEIQEIYNYRESLLNADPSTYYATIDPLTLIKPLVEEGRFRYALSGSLLGINLSLVNLNPTGYLDTYTMYPLTFEEFITAKGVGKEAISYLHDSFNAITPVEEAVHKKMLSLLDSYLLVGGMPEAVSSFLSYGDISKVRTIQKQLLASYSNDIQKYAPRNERLLIEEIYHAIPSELNRKDKHFRKSKLDYPNSKNIELRDAYLWLDNAGVALPTFNVDQPVYPLRISEDRKTFKLFYNDIGLLSAALFDRDSIAKIMNGDTFINFGAPFENFIAEELRAKRHELRYYNGKKIGEVDFLIQKEGNVIPLEGKSGKPDKNGHYSHLALDNLLSIYKDIEKAYLLSRSNLRREGDKIINIPAYMTMFLPTLNE